MRSEFGVEASAQAPKGMCMIDFKIELMRELCVHGFEHLVNRVEKALDSARQLLLLIAASNGVEFNMALTTALGAK